MHTPKWQYCEQLGHVAKYCPQLQPQQASTNCMTTNSNPYQRWQNNSAASHNITSQVSNLQLHSEYDGTDEVLIRDGSGLKITHSGSLNLPFLKRNFQVQDTLCVPSINKNLISVHHFTKHNVFLEFHPIVFLSMTRGWRRLLFKASVKMASIPYHKLVLSNQLLWSMNAPQ